MKKYGIGVNVGNTARVEGWNNLLTVSGLYIPSARPDSKYIVESRAEFTDISGFYGSEYFLNRAGFKEDWNRTKLLGDAYYKNGSRGSCSKSDYIRKECDNTGSAKESCS